MKNLVYYTNLSKESSTYLQCNVQLDNKGKILVWRIEEWKDVKEIPNITKLERIVKCSFEAFEGKTFG